MYCNLDTSWRKVATFRVWGKRPGCPVHSWMGSVETQAPSGKHAGWGLKLASREYQRETTSNCSLEGKVCCADSSLFSDWAVKTEQNQNTQGVYKEETTSKICSITITGK
jgi:hypothetical protein